MLRPTEQVTSRPLLLKLLSQACELEHGLACAYLYAAFSLKQDLAEGGLDWRQLQKVRFWAAQLYFVASQEMLHLAQAWNLLTAIGGSPYYFRPNFPQSAEYYPLHLPMVATPFNLETINRFIRFERPQNLVPPPPSGVDSPDHFHTVGGLYSLIRSGFEVISEQVLFIGDPRTQPGSEHVDFPDIVIVKDQDTALRAIDLITSQGEGIVADREDCHYGIFRTIRKEYLEEVVAAMRVVGMTFEPVRSVISNPATPSNHTVCMAGSNPITDPFSARVADCFDSIYALMLRLYQWVFDGGTSDKDQMKRFSRAALELMTTVIKPLAEGLMRLPAGPPFEFERAGPPFNLTRNVGLPLQAAHANIFVQERVDELIRELHDLANKKPERQELRRAVTNLSRIRCQAFDEPDWKMTQR